MSKIGPEPWYQTTLVFIFYVIFLLVTHELYRYYVFTMTWVYIVLFIVFFPFLLWPSQYADPFWFTKYIIAAGGEIVIMCIRISYFTQSEPRIKNWKMNKVMYICNVEHTKKNTQ